MAITVAQKDYIARELGVGNCFVYSGLSWKAVSVLGGFETETGGTGKIVSRIISGAIDHVDLTSPRVKTFKATDLTGVTLLDVKDTILTADKNPTSEMQYCAAGTTPPPPTPPTPPSMVHKVVRIVPAAGAAQEAYVSDIEIPSEMSVGNTYSGAVLVTVTTPGSYKAEVVFRRYPSGWDGTIATLPGATAAIVTEVKSLAAGAQRLNWTWTVPNIPGDFVIVSVLYMG